MTKLIITLLGSFLTIQGYSQITTNIDFQNISSWPAPAQQAFKDAVDKWSWRLSSSETINIEAHYQKLPTNILGQAKAETMVSTQSTQTNPITDPKFIPDVFYHVALAEKLTQSDVNSKPKEIVCWFNSSINWYFVNDKNCPKTQYDFIETVMHELGHGFGFSGGCKDDSTAGGLICEAQPNCFDRLLIDAQYNSYAPLTPMTKTIEDFLVTHVHFSGTEAITQNGGVIPPLFAPNPWQQGSSIAHLDPSTFRHTNHSLMTPVLYWGDNTHDPGAITMGLMNDIGWDAIVSVEELSDKYVHVEIFPNPTTKNINIKLQQDPVSITITNINGEQVLYKNTTNKEENINTLHLINGVYFVTIQFNNNTITHHKIVKL